MSDCDDLSTEQRMQMISDGIELGHAGADAAANAAGELWKAQALEAFINYAKQHKKFTSEDVRLANPEIGCNGDLRAWGHIATAAKKSGIVEHAGYARSIAAKVHGSVTTLWGSLIFEVA